MQVYRSLEQARQRLEAPSVVLIGNFDGVHRGHQALLERGRQVASADAHVVPLTFTPHPRRFFDADQPPFELTTIPQRVELLGAHGADAVMVLPFDAQIAGLSPEAFVDAILIDALRAEHVIVGEGFRFGHKRAGDTDRLRELCAAHGAEVTVHAPVTQRDDEVISSTIIRARVRRGEVDRIARLLGRPYTIWGEVVHGDARGRELGFPTANAAIENRLLPPDGIYTTTLHTPAFGELPAITYVGERPTYETDGRRNVETFVLDWQRDEPLDLYGQRVGIALHDFIRPDRAFEDSEALIAQMERDVAQARAWHDSES